MIEEFVTNVLSKADVIVTQNGDKFDLVILNERAKALKLSVLDQKPSIDILKLSRKSFRAVSHKLDYRSEQQGLGGKITMVDNDWVDIEERNVPVTKKMVPYGLKDVVDTEKLLWKELPYYKDLPVSVEKTVLSFLNTVENKPKSTESLFVCSKCRKNHRPCKLIIKKNHKEICKSCNSNKWLEYK
jgi:DNA polymerase elongation subunit (family B)